MSFRDRNTLRVMAGVEPVRTLRLERADAERDNVVRLVESLGPLSPELVLVAPELAERARALLPDAPGIHTSHRREVAERPPLRIVAPVVAVAVAPAVTPAARARFPWRLAKIAPLAAMALAAFGLGLSTAADEDGPRELQSRPPTAEPVREPSSTPVQPTPVPSLPVPPAEPLSAPRFIWPAEPGADAYRLALYRGGEVVFQRDLRGTGLQVPLTWTYGGRAQTLTRGTYRWVVWPLVGTGEKARRGPPIVSADYVF